MSEERHVGSRGGREWEETNEKARWITVIPKRQMSQLYPKLRKPRRVSVGQSTPSWSRSTGRKKREEFEVSEWEEGRLNVVVEISVKKKSTDRRQHESEVRER